MKTVRRLLSKNEPPSSWQIKKAELIRRKYGYGYFEGDINLITAFGLASISLLSCFYKWYQVLHR
jgi:hypothetical protein